MATDIPSLTIHDPATIPVATNGASVNGSKPALLTLRWVPDAVLTPPPEPPELVKGLIRKGDLVVFGAARGVGKSWMGMNLATLLSHGAGNFLGTLPVLTQATTLYSQGELDEWGSSNRWSSLCGTETPPKHVAETFDRWRLKTVKRRSTTSSRTDGIGMVDSDEFIDAVLDGRVEATIAEHNFDVLLIDPWATYYSGAENSNDEAEAALDQLRALSLRYGTTIVIFCHFGKSSEGRDPEDLWRGASRLADWASTRISLLPHYTEKTGKEAGMSRKQYRRYADVKFLLRNGELDDFSIKRNPVTGWWERWISPEEGGAAAAEDRRIDLSLDQIAAACKMVGGWGSVAAAAADLNISPHTAEKYLAWAERAQKLQSFTGPRGGKGYRI